MNRRTATAAGLLSLLLAACGGEPEQVSDDLRRDLELATASSVELAPKAGRIDIVSVVEGAAVAEPKAAPREAPTPRAKPRPSPRRAKAPAPAPRVEQVAEAEPVEEPMDAPVQAPVAETPRAPTAEPVYVPAPGPRPQPVRTPRPRGGYKTVGEVIRNAPFPINP